MQVPYTGVPEISTQAPATPKVSVQTPLAAFGGATGEALQHLGGVEEKVGSELFARANALQELNQHAEATNAVAELSDRLGDRLEQYRTLAGKAAVDGKPDFVKDVNSIRDEVGSKLTSAYAKNIYMNESRAAQSRIVLTAGSHAATEFKGYLIGTEEAKVHTAVQNANLDPHDDKAFESALAQATTAGKQLQILHGWSDEQRDDYVKTKQSKAVSERVQTIALTDPTAAQSVLDRSIKSGIINGDDVSRATAFVRDHRNRVTSRVESAALLNGEGQHFGAARVSGDRLLAAIRDVESSGDYNARGQEIVSGPYKGQRALGMYQIMPGNLQPWLKEAGMPAMSEAEFIRDHAAQDKLAQFKLMQYQEKYGSANEAARHWRGLADTDQTTGDTAGRYLQKFNKSLARSASPNEVEDISIRRAKTLIPDDPEFEYTFRDRVAAEHRLEQRRIKQEEFDNRQTVDAAIIPAQDGKLVTSIDDIKDPAVIDAWNKLSAADKLKYNNIFVRNAKGDYAATPENQREYHKWLGIMTDPNVSEDDREKALNTDYASMSMPAAQRDQLVKLRAKLFANAEKNPALGRAMRVIQPMLNEAGISRKDPDDYFEFQGILHTLLEQKIQETGKPYNDDEVKTIGARLLRQQVTKTGYFWDDKGPAYKTEVPDSERKKIIDAYSHDKGFEPSDRQIHEIYTVHQYNKLYGRRKETVKAER